MQTCLAQGSPAQSKSGQPTLPKSCFHGWKCDSTPICFPNSFSVSWQRLIYQGHKSHTFYTSRAPLFSLRNCLTLKIVIIWPLLKVEQSLSSCHIHTYQHNGEFIKCSSETSRDFQSLIQRRFQQLIHYSHQSEKKWMLKQDVSAEIWQFVTCTAELQRLRLTKHDVRLFERWVRWKVKNCIKACCAAVGWFAAWFIS